MGLSGSNIKIIGKVVVTGPMFIGSVNFSLLLLILGIGSFLVISPNILNFLLLCEIIWVSIYFYGISTGVASDSLLLFI